MKAILFALFVALLMVGCGGPDLDDKKTRDKIIAEAIEETSLQKRGKEGKQLAYAPNKQSPYTGWVKEVNGNGQVSRLQHYKYGKMDGLFIAWDENGKKRKEGNYNDGKQDGIFTSWYENGQKKLELGWKDGKPVGVSAWYSKDGTGPSRFMPKDDERVTD